ncbi:MAG: hypothetical protein R3335_12790, partial [Anaerolineales bacterium]|nr:hypothetical protein [Anaerolineales bacterium]
EEARMAALFYIVLIPPAQIVISYGAQKVDFRPHTDQRAAKVSRALAAYHAREGRPPDSLRRLVPQYLLSLSEPMIIFQEDWCYDQDGENYQFGYVTRSHWSDPNLLGHLFSAQGGDTAGLSPICTAEIEALEARDPEYYGMRP